MRLPSRPSWLAISLSRSPEAASSRIRSIVSSAFARYSPLCRRGTISSSTVPLVHCTTILVERRGTSTGLIASASITSRSIALRSAWEVVGAAHTAGRSRASSRIRSRSRAVSSTRAVRRASAYCCSTSSRSRSRCSQSFSSVRATTRLDVLVHLSWRRLSDVHIRFALEMQRTDLGGHRVPRIRDGRRRTAGARACPTTAASTSPARTESSPSTGF